MAATTLETDYLIVGAGAMSMSFADVIFHERPKAQMVIVDRRDRPGGHWIEAYPYVALHQPAAFYGVNSMPLGQGGEDLASGAEIAAYYHLLMKRFVASGRVRFMGMSEYRGEGRVVSTLDPDHVTHVHARQRVVDGGFMNVQIPSVTPPKFAVDPAITLVPPNLLPRVSHAWQRFVVAGGGKTGTDAIVFLLRAGVAPERIQWIVPNDSWLWMRDLVQPGIAQAEFMRHLDSVVSAGSVDEIFLTLERQGSVIRIDPDVMPEKWRCATISMEEVTALRRITNVVRMGRIQRISADQIELDQGSIPTNTRTLHVDCTANGLERRPPQPLFAAGAITLQSLVMCQQVFSAALIARMELLDLDDAARNALCEVVPHPESKHDHPTCLLATFRNLLSANKKMPFWLRRSRLNLLHHESLISYLSGAIKITQRLPLAEASYARMLKPVSERDAA